MAKPVRFCRHCGETILRSAECKLCKKALSYECSTCHRELVHGVITNQNVHFVGNPESAKLCSGDADPDAYGHPAEPRY